jgi:hypothetical protein
MEFIAPMLLGTAFFTLIGWVTHVIVDGRRRRERLKVFTDFHSKLIDRMGSANEFGDFLQSPGGQRFLDTLSTERGGPQVGIMRSVHTGIVMLALGVGFLFLGRIVVFNSEGRAFVVAMGILLLSLAIGFILSAGASWRLASSMGLMKPDGGDASAGRA